MNITTLAWRNVGRNRRRSVLSVVAIAIATLTIVFLFSLIEGMKRDLEYNLTTFFTGEVQLRNREYGAYEHLHPLHLSVKDTGETLSGVSAVQGVRSAVPRLTIPGAVFQDSRRVGLQAVGVDFTREESYSDVGRYIVAGDFAAVTAPAEQMGRITPALVGNGVLDHLGIGVGDQFTLVVRTALRGTNAMTFRASAVADFPVQSLNERAFWIPLERARRLAQMPDQAGEILLKLDDDARIPAVIAAIRTVAPQLEVRHFSEIGTSYTFIEMASKVYNIIALFFFLLASTVIVNTTMMVIFERRREIGTLEAMGMQSRELIRMFFMEALILGVIGAAVGLFFGIGVSLVLGQVGINLGSAMDGVDFEVSTVLYPVLNLRSTMVVFFFSIAVSGATSYIPTRKITRIEPVAALREE